MSPFIDRLESELLPPGAARGALGPETRFRLQPWWDSLAALVMLATFQEVYGKQLRPEDLRACETLGDVMALAKR